MTVRELIVKLREFPEDAVVIGTYCSDYAETTDEDIRLHKAEDKSIVLRRGAYIDYREKQWPKDEVPEFVTIVHFSGN